MEKRLGIFVIYDPDGIVDGYREYLLNDISENLSDIVIVCNGYMQEAEIDKLHKYTSRVYVRENRGFDAGAIKYALCEKVGWDEIKDCDEVVFFNDSFYGPLYPFKHVFDAMDSRDVDFWGITRHKKTQGAKYDHIQSYFYAVRKKMALSDDFRCFWTALDTHFKGYWDAVNNYEIIFTNHFETLGYKWDVYSDTSKLEEYTPGRAFNPFVFAHKLVSQCNCPIIKRKAFSWIRNSNLVSEKQSEGTLEYVRLNTEYDERLIWNNLARNYSEAELIRIFNLYYVLPIEAAGRKCRKKVAVVIFIGTADFLDDCIEYIHNIPEFADAYISTDSPLVLHRLKNHFEARNNFYMQLVDNEASSALLEIQDACISRYDYICLINHKKYDENISAYETASYLYNSWHNVLAGSGYILNVINTFEQNRRIGILAAPKLDKKQYFRTLQERSGFNADALWCRTCALRSNNHIQHDAEAGNANRDYIRISRHAGYYTGIIASAEYAKMELFNNEIALSAMLSKLSNDYMFLDSSLRAILLSVENIARRAIVEHITEPVYIYGAGDIGTQYFEKLSAHGVNISGFIVSDGHKKADSYMGHPIYELKDIKSQAKSCSIVAGVGAKHIDDVLKNLKTAGFNNILNDIS